jgi:hypothetical protein
MALAHELVRSSAGATIIVRASRRRDAYRSHMGALPIVVYPALALALAACAAAPAPPPDLFNGPAYSGRDSWENAADPPPAKLEVRDAARQVTARTTTTGAASVVAVNRRAPVRFLVRATVHVVGSDGATVFYGDEEQGTLMQVPASGGAATLLARPAPLDLVVDGAAVTWVARAGNAILRVARSGGEVAVAGEPGSFTSLAAHGGELFAAEKVATGGAVALVRKTSVTRIATVSSAPRGLEVDATHVYVLTERGLERAPRTGGEPQPLAAVRDPSDVKLDAEHVYFTAESQRGRALLRVPKAGGSVVELLPSIRDAPIAIYRDSLYYFDPRQPELLRVMLSAQGASPPMVVARNDAFGEVTALAVDDRQIYVGTAQAGLMAVTRPRRSLEAHR